MTKSDSKTTTAKAATKKVAKKKAAKKKVTTKKVAKKTVAKKAPVKKAAATKSAAPKPPKPKITADQKRVMIAVHAYYKWQQAGYPSGQDRNHWLEAEREIDEMLK